MDTKRLMLHVAFHKTVVHRLLGINTPVSPAPLPVVENLDVFSDLLYYLAPAFVTVVMDKLVLERSPKAFDLQVL